ncbi:MAG TPA: SDR family oxidoreductase [Bryobacteraceae bacterium]|nr:SDR family oxidoreductase [Bryobacteraceae bacterium]
MAGSLVPSVKASFDLTGQVAMITGGSGLLGIQHAAALAELGAHIALLDISDERGEEAVRRIVSSFGVKSLFVRTDITNPASISDALAAVLQAFGRVDILINNAANNPKPVSSSEGHHSRFETFSLDTWNDDLGVGLTGSFLCSQIVGREMARARRGVILNVASDLALIAPDQRIYRVDGVPEEAQPVKAVTYSVVKAGLVGLTRYLASYWADAGVRANAICPGGVFNDHEEAFVHRLVNLIPMGRMARVDEYKAAVAFLCSGASSYMTGSVLVVDGGRTCW